MVLFIVCVFLPMASCMLLDQRMVPFAYGRLQLGNPTAYGSVALTLQLHLKYFHRQKPKLQHEVELKEMTKLFLFVPSYNLSDVIHTAINSGHLNCKDDIIFEPSENTRNPSISKTPQLKL